MTQLQNDTIFAGRYRVVRCIAAGGMGAVYEVLHIETERRRALKVMHAHIVDSEELRQRFKREAKVAAQIESDFIVDVFDAGVDEPTQMPFLVMELLRGEELGHRLARAGRFESAEALVYLWQTALALDKTHRANVVHRDLKPQNLFLNQRDDGPPRIKVLDFGVAKFVAETGTHSAATRSLGTPLYMSPEQFRSQKISPAADNYALAMMAFTLLVGEAYWAPEAAAGDDIIAFALKACIGPVEPASARAARLGVRMPPAFDAWFARATSADPLMRYPTATQTIAALGEVFGMHPAQLTGLAASNPLPESALAATAALGTGTVLGTPPGMGTPLPAMPLPVVPTIANVAVTSAPRPRSSPTLPLAMVAALALAAVGVGWFVFRSRAEVDPAASADSPTTASAEPQPSTTQSSITESSAAQPTATEPTATAAPSASTSSAASAEPRADTPPAAPPPATPPPGAPQPPRPAKPRYTRD